jgi:hypothetical protein
MYGMYFGESEKINPKLYVISRGLTEIVVFTVSIAISIIIPVYQYHDQYRKCTI